MILAVVGSRTFTNYQLFVAELDRYSDITRIISGGAKGADMMARRYAKENNITIREYIPNWNLYGKSAGYKRNVFIVDDADQLIAFWDSTSRGTKHSIGLGFERNIPVRVILYKGSV